nr:hypothetical protein [uncultured Ligilactobacillus sp.]
MFLEEDLRFIFKSLKLHIDELFTSVNQNDRQYAKQHAKIINSEISLIKDIVNNSGRSVNYEQSNVLDRLVKTWDTLFQKFKKSSQNRADLQSFLGDSREDFEDSYELFKTIFNF